MSGKQIDLATVIIILTQAQTDCDKFATNQQCGYTSSNTSATLVAGDVAFPCGARGRSFNQIMPEIRTFQVNYANGTQVNWERNNIAWSSDISLASDNWDLSKQPFSLKDEDWLVWNRPAARSDFYKLFARIPTNLPAGDYTITWTYSIK